MRCFAIKKSDRSNRLAWFLVPVLLAAFVFAGAALFMSRGAHAASAAPANVMAGHYSLRAITTAGPASGTYFTGAMDLTVSGSNVSGKVCGLSYAKSRCTTATGTASGNDVTVMINDIGGMHDVQLTGTFHMASNARGSFTGFSGTFSSGDGSKVSTGRWEAALGSVQTASGTWQVYLLVKVGSDAGKTFHGVMTLVEDGNGHISGQYCPSHGSCMVVKGDDQFGYLHIELGTLFVLKGTFSGSHRADGQFYIPGSHAGYQNYWLAH